jgi:hypothetical protein
MNWRLLGAAGAVAVAVRVAHARHRRILHPVGRSFTAEVDLWGLSGYVGDADLLQRRERHPALVRVSKGGGTPPRWPDVLGFSVRVDDRDLLFSTAGQGRFSRHLPVPRRGFDTGYGSILAYRTAEPDDGPLYLSAVPEPGAAALGHTLDDVAAAAATGRARFLLVVDDRHGTRPFGRVTLGAPLPADADAALAFDPVRHTAAGLHPSGLVHASRAWAYRLGQWWRGADADRGAAGRDDAAPQRAAAHR